VHDLDEERSIAVIAGFGNRLAIAIDLSQHTIWTSWEPKNANEDADAGEQRDARHRRRDTVPSEPRANPLPDGWLPRGICNRSLQDLTNRRQQQIELWMGLDPVPLRKHGSLNSTKLQRNGCPIEHHRSQYPATRTFSGLILNPIASD